MFAAKNVNVTLKWIQESDVFYNVSIEPKKSASLIEIGSTNIKFITLYNVSIIGSSIHCNSATSYYTKINLI